MIEISGWIDSMTTARITEALADWQPQSTSGVVGRAVADGLIGLVGIVAPYMIPLVMLRTIGRRQALFSVSLSVAAALLVGGSLRLALGGIQMAGG